jgi:hypothetical protein
MTHEDYKTVLYRQDHGFRGCRDSRHCRMLCADEFALIAEEFRQEEQPFPADATENVNG